MPLFLPHPPAPCPSELGKGSFSSEFVFCMINLHLLRAQSKASAGRWDVQLVERRWQDAFLSDFSPFSVFCPTQMFFRTETCFRARARCGLSDRMRSWIDSCADRSRSWSAKGDCRVAPGRIASWSAAAKYSGICISIFNMLHSARFKIVDNIAASAACQQKEQVAFYSQQYSS